MNAKDIVVGEYYRHKDNPNYCYAKVLKILKPKQEENNTNYVVAKCEYVINKNDTVGLIKYFKISNLKKETKNGKVS